MSCQVSWPAVAADAVVPPDHDSYGQIEEYFQDVLHESLDPDSRTVLYDLVAGMGLAAGAQVLDVGCGDGRHSIELARRFGLTVQGIEPSPQSLGIARQDLDRADQDHPGLARQVSFAPGSAQILPAADQSADLIWCRDVLCLVDGLDAAYAEFRRVLRPGARALVYQMFTTDRLAPAEAAWLLNVMGCCASSMRPEVTEAAVIGAGLRIDECMVVASQWHEYAQERTGAPGRDLLHAARLLRDPGRYISQFGQGNYDIKLADCLWHIYQMIGKLSGRVYLLSAAPPG